MAITSAFQAEDAGSIPAFRSKFLAFVLCARDSNIALVLVGDRGGSAATITTSRRWRTKGSADLSPAPLAFG